MPELLLRQAHDLLAGGTPLVLVSIVSSKGSAPRTAGARMLVFPGGCAGTIGGGKVEAEAALLARDHLAQAVRHGAARDAIMRASLAGKTDMDMICGGLLCLLLETILPAAPKALLLGELNERLRSRASFCRLTRVTGLTGETPTPCMTESLLFDPAAGSIFPADGGPLPDEKPLDGARKALRAKSAPYLTENGTTLWFVEPFFPEPSVYIFGAGHVSMETAALAARAGFRTAVIDDRPELVTVERFPDATLAVLPDLEEEAVARYLTVEAPGPDDAVIILTRGHAHDKSVLAATLEHHTGYTGMIGSRAKRESLFAALEQRSVGRSRLESVHSPIGLPIGAETPAEIAVSIVAELIQWRRRGPVSV